MSVPAVIYAVRSQADQRSRDGGEGSTEQQVAGVCARLAKEPNRTIIGTFKEDGFSGSKRNRGPQLEAAIRAAVGAAEEHGQAELWAFISSRFARGTGKKGEARAVGALFYELRAKGVALRTVADDQFVTNQMLIGFASEQASKYVEDLSENVKRGKTTQFKRGVWLGGPIPEGYAGEPIMEAGRSRQRLVLDAARQPVIARMFELAQEGWGQPTIARKMNAEGYRTALRVRRDGTVKPARPWTRRSVQNILTNPVYAGGIVRHRGTPQQEINWDGEHRDLAYISRAEWEALQAGFASRDVAKKGRPQSGQPTRRYALAKIAECAMCGGRMFATTSPYKRKDGSHNRQYVCENYKNSTGLCDRGKVDASKVDAWIIEDLHALTFDFDSWLARVSSTDHAEREAAQRELDHVEAERAQQDKRVRKLEATIVRWVAEGHDERADALADTLAGEQQTLAGLDSALSNLRARLAQEPDHRDAVDGALDWWNTVRRQIVGAQEDANNLGDVNDLLKELFSAFRLSTRPDKTIFIEPVLRLPDNVARHQWDDNDPTTLVSDTFLAPSGAAMPVLVGNQRNAHE